MTGYQISMRRPPELLCHDWLLSRSYLICDSTPGHPIVYASASFLELFQADAKSVLGKKCGEVVGVQSILSEAASLAAAVELSSLSPLEAHRALEHLHQCSIFQVQKMVQDGIAAFNTVNKSFDGRIFNVAVVMSVIEHPVSMRRFAVGLQVDVSDSLSVSALMRSVLEPEAITRQEKSQVLESSSELIQSDAIIEFLHRKIADIYPTEHLSTFSAVASYTRPTSKGNSLSQRRQMKFLTSPPGCRPISIDKLEAAGSSLPVSRRRQNKFLTSPPGCRPISIETIDYAFKHSVSCDDAGIWAPSASSRTLREAEGVVKDISDQQMSRSCAQLLLDKGYTVGCLLARSTRNQRSRVVAAQSGNKSYAIKYVSELTGDLESEFNILSGLCHPGIIQAIDIIRCDDYSAMVMEFCPGRSLAQVLPECVGTRLAVVQKLLSALEYLHVSHTIAHRDLKAENIIVSLVDRNRSKPLEDISVKLIDFGSARKCTPWRNSQSSSKSVSSQGSEKASSFHSGIDERILPPARKDGGRTGNSFELDMFAFGLIVASIFTRKQMFSSHIFIDGELQLRWPEQDLLQQYIQGLLNVDPDQRLGVQGAIRTLPVQAL